MARCNNGPNHYRRKTFAIDVWRRSRHSKWDLPDQARERRNATTDGAEALQLGGPRLGSARRRRQTRRRYPDGARRLPGAAAPVAPITGYVVCVAAESSTMCLLINVPRPTPDSGCQHAVRREGVGRPKRRMRRGKGDEQAGEHKIHDDDGTPAQLTAGPPLARGRPNASGGIRLHARRSWARLGLFRCRLESRENNWHSKRHICSKWRQDMSLGKRAISHFF